MKEYHLSNIGNKIIVDDYVFNFSVAIRNSKDYGFKGLYNVTYYTLIINFEMHKIIMGQRAKIRK